jgi:hypothetical protein
MIDLRYYRVLVGPALGILVKAQKGDSVPFADQSSAQHTDDHFRAAQR